MQPSNKSSPLGKIREKIVQIAEQCGRDPTTIQLLAVTKNQTSKKIITLLNEGHRLFGENRIQEAQNKWPSLKDIFPGVSLHLIGHLQSNKVKEAVALFDVIETLDSLALAKRLQREEEHQKKQLEYFIQLNVGKEPQKSGIFVEDFDDFYRRLKTETKLNISGIMCVPPQDQEPDVYFQKMSDIGKKYGFLNISMGMSNDYQIAIEKGATIIRLGRALMDDLTT